MDNNKTVRGIIRPLDNLGRIVIPKEWRTQFGLKEGQPMEITAHEDGFWLTVLPSSCLLCGCTEEAHLQNITASNGKTVPVCDRCLALIK